MNTCEEYESEVRTYCRHFPAVFSSAEGSSMYTVKQEEYLDFFCGAGALNYGHNHPEIKKAVITYLQGNGIMHSLDMYTQAKMEFIDTFQNRILRKRNLDYKMMFCGPTGTNANEAALKIARKAKKRSNVFAFMGAFHGMTLGSLALTSDSFSRKGAGTGLSDVTFMPFPFGYNTSFDTIAYIDNVLTDDHSGIAKPAAIFCETVQAEGGVVIADTEWLKRLRALCDKHDILLICDEIQVGCGRTGSFFSFERAGIVPDMVSLSKSISGLGLPMSLLLIKPEIDCLAPGEHNGTFRGSQLSFVGAKRAAELFDEVDIPSLVKQKEKIICNYITQEILPMDERLEHRGIGCIHGIDFSNYHLPGLARMVADECFKKGLIIELAGRGDSVLKLMPALVISNQELLKGLEIIKKSMQVILKKI